VRIEQMSKGVFHVNAGWEKASGIKPLLR